MALHDNFSMRCARRNHRCSRSRRKRGADTRHTKRRAAHAAKKRHRAVPRVRAAADHPRPIRRRAVVRPPARPRRARRPATATSSAGRGARSARAPPSTSSSDAILDIRARFPDVHVLAIGDLSQKHGGAITEHRSHQSGRDADIGLIYKEQPAGFPEELRDRDRGQPRLRRDVRAALGLRRHRASSTAARR